MPSRPSRQDGGLTAKRGFLGSITRFWQRTYAPDYVGLSALLVAYILVISPIFRR
jgi:diacylglycerol diphosphate phosphatase/phosphatidate phosphatase